MVSTEAASLKKNPSLSIDVMCTYVHSTSNKLQWIGAFQLFICYHCVTFDLWCNVEIIHAS